MRRIFYSILLVLFSYGHVQADTTATKKQHAYVNEEIGIKVNLPDNWNIYTEHASAPEIFKSQLVEGKNKNDSPLFLAMTDDQQIFARLLTDKTDLALQDYFTLLAAMIEASAGKIVSAKSVPEKNSIQWEYKTEVPNQPKILFRERVTILPDARVLRLTFWSLEPLVQKYSDEIDKFYHGVEFLEKEGTWNKTWAGLESLLPQQNIEGINIVAAPKKQVLVCKDPSSTLLWKVKGDNNTVYLFGSLHIGKADFYPLHDNIEAAFKRSKHLVLEVNTQSEETKQAIKGIAARGTLGEGEKLSDFISEPVINSLHQVLFDLGLPPDNFIKYKPWFLTLVLAQLQYAKLGFISDYGIETYFVDNKPDAMDILELETFEDQLALLEELNNEEYLAYSLLGFKAGQAKIDLMIKAWRCADKKKLRGIIFDESGINILDLEDIYQKIFFDRNIKMAKKIEKFTKEGKDDYFVVVGAGHLIGDKSIIDLLKKSGHEVTAVMKN